MRSSSCGKWQPTATVASSSIRRPIVTAPDKDVYDSLGDRVLTLLQVQSDHERQLANLSSCATLANADDDDYHGPVMT